MKHTLVARDSKTGKVRSFVFEGQVFGSENANKLVVTETTPKDCDYCEGLGFRTVSVENEYGLGEIQQEECEKCRGAGVIKTSV